MILNKTKNTTRNIIFGSVLKIYQIILPFVFRTVMLYTLGVQYLGLNSLFTSVLEVLNLAELGVGSAMVFSMYKPIAEDDSITICALMKLYRLYYRIIGIVILVIGLACTPFIPRLINGEVPDDINVYILYILNLSATVLTYWLFAYKNSILQAHQRQDVKSKVTIITDTIKYGMQLIALVAFKNYYLYVICILISQVLSNILTAIIADKMYPDYKPLGNLPEKDVKAINQRIRDLFTAKLGGTIVSSADTIVISAFLGLKVLAMYQNYYYILNAVMSFIIIINNSALAGIGNSMITNSREKNYKDFEIFSFIEFWIIGFCICCFSTLYQPFMSIWMGKELLFDYPMVVLLCLYFLGNQFEKMLSTFKDAGGIWHEDRFRPLIYGLANLFINIIFVQFIGIYGVVLSTILTVFGISIPWIIHNVFKLVFKQSCKEYLKKLAYYLIIIVISVVCCNIVGNLFRGNDYVLFLLRGITSVILSNIIFILAYHKMNEFAATMKIVKRILHK